MLSILSPTAIQNFPQKPRIGEFNLVQKRRLGIKGLKNCKRFGWVQRQKGFSGNT